MPLGDSTSSHVVLRKVTRTDNFELSYGRARTLTWWPNGWGKNKNISYIAWEYSGGEGGGWGWIRNYPGINLMSQKDYVSPLRMGT